MICIEVVLSIRGTLSMDDALTDACADSCPYNGGWIHKGMYEAAKFVIEHSLEYIKQAQASNVITHV